MGNQERREGEKAAGRHLASAEGRKLKSLVDRFGEFVRDQKPKDDKK